jgi:hypothetical protein
MRRSDNRGPYRAVVCLEDTLDALDWCNEEHRSRNSFYFGWVFLRDDGTPDQILGEFYFTSPKDHMLFTMRWGK